MMSHLVCTVVIILLCLPMMTISALVQSGEAATHCIDTTGLTDPVSQGGCAYCFFPQNCMVNNTCAEGTAGWMCEKCQHMSMGQGYYRLGNGCAPCGLIPWSSVGLGVYLLLIMLAVIYNGLSVSMATKIKQLSNLLQFLLLALSIKVPWSGPILQTMAIFQFSMFNSELITPACLMADSLALKYLEWGSSIAVLMVTLVVVWALDGRLGAVISRPEKTDAEKRALWVRRGQYRRLAFITVSSMYVPITRSAIQSFSCSSDPFPLILVLFPGKQLFLYDLSVNCDEFVFAAVNSMCTLVMVIYSFIFPLVLLFFTLRQKKWKRLQSSILQYGCAYESYKDSLCFWEFFLVLIKLGYIIITYTYPFTPLNQCIAHMCTAGFYLVLTLLFRPYKKFSWTSPKLQCISTANVFEVLSTMCVLSLETLALFSVLEIALPAIVDYIFIGLLTIVLVIWLVMTLALPAEAQTNEHEELELPERVTMEMMSSEPVWKRNTAGEALTDVEIRERRRMAQF